MSKISIKTDFQDGDKLFAADLNNNFRVIQAGVNANEENLEEIIEQAIVRLDNELIEITADRGWDWNGGDRVTFYKGDTDDIEDRNIINGQMLYNTETGETYLDDNSNRIVTGSGNVIAITETEPENPATKLWIDPTVDLQNVGTEVVNSMAGNQTNIAPSVSAVKGYVEDAYSTSETLTNKVWIDGNPIYRKVVSYELTQDYAYPECSTGITNAEYVKINSTRYYGTNSRYAKDASALNYYFDRRTGNIVFIEVEDNVLKPPLGFYWFIIEYTKTTN